MQTTSLPFEEQVAEALEGAERCDVGSLFVVYPGDGTPATCHLSFEKRERGWRVLAEFYGERSVSILDAAGFDPSHATYLARRALESLLR